MVWLFANVQILSMLVADVSPNTVAKLLMEAGNACEAFHDREVRNVKSKRVQCDEIWSLCYAKQKNVETAKTAPEGAGDLWTWTALDADTKLIISYLCGGRDAGYAHEFMQDVADRLADPDAFVAQQFDDQPGAQIVSLWVQDEVFALAMSFSQQAIPSLLGPSPPLGAIRRYGRNTVFHRMVYWREVRGKVRSTS